MHVRIYLLDGKPLGTWVVPSAPNVGEMMKVNGVPCKVVERFWEFTTGDNETWCIVHVSNLP